MWDRLDELIPRSNRRRNVTQISSFHLINFLLYFSSPFSYICVFFYKKNIYYKNILTETRAKIHSRRRQPTCRCTCKFVHQRNHGNQISRNQNDSRNRNFTIRTNKKYETRKLFQIIHARFQKAVYGKELPEKMNDRLHGTDF